MNPDLYRRQTTTDPLVAAVRQNQLDTVQAALDLGHNPDTRDQNGASLLLLATRLGQADMASLLLQYRADVNLQDHIHDSSFLYAGASGQTELVRLYLQHGARFDVYNRFGGTALIPACERGHLDTVRLLAHTPGFPIDHINRLHWTALLEAIILGDGSAVHVSIVQTLLEAGCNPHITDKDGITAIQHARLRRLHQMSRLLEQY